MTLSLMKTLKEMHIIDNGISPQEAKTIIKHLKIDFAKEPFSFEQFLIGANHEIEHKKEVNNSPTKIAQIAMDHLREDPEYYDKIAKIEGEK